MEKDIEKNLEALNSFIDAIMEFAVSYGFQIVGALVFLLIGLKLAGWAGSRVIKLAETKNIDPSLSNFIGGIVKLVVIVFVAIITLGNFGISIAPLIALAGAGAFGATLALQGPLSNYGAGLSIILSRNFAVGNTITVGKVSGVVNDVKLAATVLIGEDGEKITIPNKEIVGQVIVNSLEKRIVETRIAIGYSEDADKAIAALTAVLDQTPEIDGDPPQIGVHDFTYGGVIIGLRFWVPTQHYFQHRYAINGALLRGLREAGISLQPPGNLAVSAPDLSADGETPGAPPVSPG